MLLKSEQKTVQFEATCTTTDTSYFKI